MTRTLSMYHADKNENKKKKLNVPSAGKRRIAIITIFYYDDINDV